MMPTTCMGVAKWAASLPVNWDALSAIGTVGATIVALFLPWYMGRKEKAKEAALHREIASTVERILAYRDVALAIFDAEPVYHVGNSAIKKIGSNVKILADLSMLLIKRPGLSDGALYSALAADRIAQDVINMTGELVDNWGVRDPKWGLRKIMLNRHDQLAGMIKLRVAGVRKSYKLQPSRGAAAIKDKYLPLAEAIEEARRLNTGEPSFDLEETYY